MWKTNTDLLIRYKNACNFNRRVYPEKVNSSLKRFFKILGVDVEVKPVGSFKIALAALAAWDALDARADWAALAAWDAWDARAAWDAQAARAAWAALADRDARVAWSAWDARAARAAWAALADRDARAARAAWATRDAWDARAARDVRDAWDASYYSITAIGFEENGNEREFSKWLSYFEAFEFGAWFTFHLDNEVLWIPIPKLEKDLQNRCHADGKPALTLPEEKLYFWHGVSIPDEWGSIRSENWKPEWLLKEKNAERRRVLIQGLGYGRILKSLNAKKLDSWREYELHKITESVDVEQIVLVSMKCPSTGLLHCHRVAPNITTAREAIKAVNGGVDAEEFFCET